MTDIKWITNEQLFSEFGYRGAITAIADLLESGYDPATDKPRSFVDFQHGQGLIMPSEIGEYVGLKFVTVAPANPSKNLERIQGIYTLFDSKTLTPLAQCDGASLTLLRTASVSAAIISKLRLTPNPHVVVFGSGPQALAHIHALREIAEPASISIIARNKVSLSALIEKLNLHQIVAQEGAAADLKNADLIITATTSREPLFSLSDINPKAVVVAVGSHEPDAREIASDVMATGQVFIEERSAALREAGDVIMAIAEGGISESSLVEIKQLFAPHKSGLVTPDSEKIRVYKSTGMPWQDLAIFGALNKH